MQILSILQSSRANAVGPTTLKNAVAAWHKCKNAALLGMSCQRLWHTIRSHQRLVECCCRCLQLKGQALLLGLLHGCSRKTCASKVSCSAHARDLVLTAPTTFAAIGSLACEQQMVSAAQWAWRKPIAEALHAGGMQMQRLCSVFGPHYFYAFWTTCFGVALAAILYAQTVCQTIAAAV